MEQNQTPKRRVRFSELLELQDKEIDLKQIPQTESLGMGRGSEDPAIESEFVASVAAAAFAVHSLEETRTNYQKKMVASFKEKKRSQTSNSVSRKGSFRLPFDISDNNSNNGVRRRTRLSENEIGREIMVRTNSVRSVDDRAMEEQRRVVLTKAEAWERDELTKIDKKYKTMISDITKWENERKMKAKLLMEKRKAELERMRKLTLMHYQRRRDWVERVASGAKTQLEEKKRSDESNVKAKAKRIRSTGKLPIKCLCFEYYRS